MLSNITWQQYLIVIGIATLAYYLIITWLFYRKQIFRLLRGKSTLNPMQTLNATAPPNLMGAIQEVTQSTPAENTEPPSENTSNQDLEFAPDDDYADDELNEAYISDAFDELEQLSMRLRAVMEKSGKKANRTELTQKIREELAAFSSKTNPENFKEAINRFVRQQCKELCNVQIEPADLKVIWS